MTYKIDKDLPWFPAKAILKEDMYVNIISTKYADELNPNGLFSGFLSGQVFFTSKWDGYSFVSLEIPLGSIEKVLFLEYVEKPKNKKDFRKDSSNKERSLEDIIKESMDRARREQARNTFYPGGRIPYQNTEDASKHWEDVARIISKGSKTLFNNKDFNTVFKNWEDIFNTPNKDIK